MVSALLYTSIVAIILIQSFIRFAGASYIWYDNVRSGTVGDR
jgi:TRAP-type C4-dicarboxylate transport system permease small subunit